MVDPISRLIEFDLFALSSDTEQLPIAVLEADILVVAIRVGDVALIVPAVAQPGVAEPTDAAFTAALLNVIDSRSAWPEWAAAGERVVAERYAMEHMQSQWQSSFDGG